MILLKKIQLTNFLSHENTTVEFEDNEKILIDGASGAGKSSIFDAIIWALYGVSRADNRSLVRKGSKMGAVTLTLNNNGEILIITRRTTSAGKHVLELMTEQLNGSRVAYPLSGVRELQSHIEKNIIGASYLLFVNSVAYVQGNTESFVSQTAPKRKELLLEIVKAEDYTKYYENARQTLAKLDNEHIKASTEIDYLGARLVALKGYIAARGTHSETISRDSKLLAMVGPIIRALEEEKAGFLAIAQNINNLDNALRTALYDTNIAQLELEKKQNKLGEKEAISQKLSTAPTIVIKLDSANKLLEEVRKELGAASKIEAKRNEVMGRAPRVNDANFADIEQCKVKIAKLKSQPVCPSGTNCPYSGDHEGTIRKLHEDIGRIEKVIQTETAVLDAWKLEVEALPPRVDMETIMASISLAEVSVRDLNIQLGKLESLQKDLELIEEIEKEIPKLKTDLEEKQLRVIKAKKDKASAESSTNNAEMNRVSDELAKRKLEEDDFKANIIRATAALETIDKNELEMKETEAKIEGMKTKDIAAINDKIRKVEMVKQAFGSKGIETLVLDYLLPKLEDKINEVLSKLSDFRVHLDTQKKNADGTQTVEGLFITIINDINEEMSFENYSGGEKLKISVAISEALATLQKVGFRLFDETFIGLDENSTESFANILDELQQNFSQVLCISHLLQIKELFDKQLKIVKTKNISYVR